jgi:PAS domain S-box-containing protein
VFARPGKAMSQASRRRAWWQSCRGSPRARALLVAALILILLLPLWWQAGEWYEALMFAEQRGEGAVEISVQGSALAAVLNRRFARLQGLTAFVQADSSPAAMASGFERFAASLYAGSSGVVSLALAPGGIVRHVYPLEGNQSMLGYRPLEDSRAQVRADVQRAIETQEIILSGPLELVQGGLGLIARQAVYEDGEYWGLVSVVLDVPTLVEEAGINETGGELDLAIRDNLGVVFFGQERVFERDPVVNVIELPEGAWELAGVPRDGWAATVRVPLRIFQISGFVIIILLSSLGYLTTSRQRRLTEAVEERSEELREREQQYRSVFEGTGDGLIVSDEGFRVVEANPAACTMFGYDHEELVNLSLPALVQPGDEAPFVGKLEEILKGRSTPITVQAVGRRRDGTPLYIELRGSSFAFGGKPHVLGVVRDITERIQAREHLEQRVEQRTRELAALLEVSRSVTATLELGPLLALILDQLARVVHYSGAGVIGAHGDGFGFLDYRGSALGQALSQLQFSPRQIQAWADIAKGRGWILVDDLSGDDPAARLVRALIKPEQQAAFGSIRSWLGVPLMAKDNLIGLLHIDHQKPGRFSEQDARLALGVANQATVAIENARLYRQARQLAILEERQRLARELHDSVSQALYGIGLGARTAREWLDRDPSQAAGPLEYVHSLAQAGLAEMRALIFELRPDSLEREGIAGALGKQAAVLRSRHGLDVITELDPEPALSVAIKEALYRIAQEALNNIVKHAQAGRVQILLQAQAGGVLLEIHDDGIGFDPDAVYPGHLGLQTMRERAATLSGTFEIDSGPGQGTRLKAYFPIG